MKKVLVLTILACSLILVGCDNQSEYEELMLQFTAKMLVSSHFCESLAK